MFAHKDHAFDVAIDTKTGARAYSFEEGSRKYVVGLGLRTIASKDRVMSLLESAGSTGMFSYGDEIVFLEPDAQDALSDEAYRRDLVSAVVEERGFGGRHLLQATAAPLDDDIWRQLTMFHSPKVAFDSFVAYARDHGTLRGVAYPIRAGSRWDRSLERGPRIEHGDRSESLDLFLDQVITLTTHAIETDPRKATAPMTVGRSYVFEREVASRVS